MQVTFDRDDLRRLVVQIVAELQQQYGAPDAPLTSDEQTAAKILGVPRHVLRDARLRGEISPRRIGKGYRYTRRQLVEYAEGDADE